MIDKPTYEELEKRIQEIEQAEPYSKKFDNRSEDNENLSQIINGMAIPTFVINKEHIVTHWNRACERLTGFSAESIIGTRDAWKAFYPAKRPVLADLIVDHASKNLFSKHYSGNYTKSDLIKGAYESHDFFPHIGGHGKWLFFTATPLKDSLGSVIGAIETFQDTTERKLIEDAMLESQDKLKTIVESVNSGIIIIDLETRTLVDANRYARDLIGVSKEQIIGKKCHDFICPAEKNKCPIMDLKEKLDNSERILLNIKGERIPILKTVTPITLGGKKHLLESFIDIRELKRADEEKNLLETRLQQAQRMESIGTLAGGIAHDFNNILFPIMGHTEMLLERIQDDSTFQHSLNSIYTSANRAKDLVRQILAFSRQDSSELGLMKIQPIIKETLKLIRSTIPTTISIKQDIRPDCGPIKADPTQIHQILMNLSTNAFHAVEDSGGELKVTLREVELGKLDLIHQDMEPGFFVCLTVGDNGIGMDKNLIEKIFNPFFTTKKKEKGTGMGLSVVHGIVRSSGGSIHVYSEPGKGSEFRVYLPVIQSISKESKVQKKEFIRGGTETILLVDDESAIISMEKQMLERLGYQVVSRSSSIEALEAFRVAPDKFDLVITDMAMPKMPGDELAAEMIKIRPATSILLCTGFSEAISEEKAASLGIKGLLMKPMILKELAQTIRTIFDHSPPCVRIDVGVP